MTAGQVALIGAGFLLEGTVKGSIGLGLRLSGKRRSP